MKDIIKTQKISQILLDEFIQLLGISAYKPVKDIYVPASRIQDMLKKQKINVDTSLLMAVYFNLSGKYF